MIFKKKFLLRSILILLSPLSPLSTGDAQATSIVNMNDVPHNIRMEIAGSESEVTLWPYQRWESHFYPIRVVYDTYTTPALERHGHYAIWNGGKIALQNNGRRVYRRY